MKYPQRNHTHAARRRIRGREDHIYPVVRVSCKQAARIADTVASSKMIDEDAVFRKKRDRFFADVSAGNDAAIRQALDQSPLTDFRGDIYNWTSMLTDDGRTAFIVAAENGHVQALRLLADGGADIKACNSSGKNALHAATENNRLDAVQLLIATLGLSVDVQDRELRSPLHLAAECSHLPAMRLLLELKATVDSLDECKSSPLSLAAKHGRHEACALLLAHDASLHLQDHASKSPLEHAEEQLARIFWFHAAKQGDVKALRRLLGRQIGAQGDEGFRELNRALYHPQGQDMLRLNLHRVLCNAKRDADGATALSIAVQGGHVEAVTYLLSQTADVSISDDMRETPLHHACRAGHVQLAGILIDERAPLEALNWGDAAPIHIATFLNHAECVRALLSASANVHMTDQQHQTPLHIAVLERHAESAKVLLEFGASASATDRHHRTVGNRAAEATQNAERPRPRRPDDAQDYELRPPDPPTPAVPYVVCHSKIVAVRSSPSLQGGVIGARVPGETVMVVEVRDGWARLDAVPPHAKPHKADTKRTADMEAWMLIDATGKGLPGVGKLLEPAAQLPDGAKAEATAGSDDDSDD